MSLLFAGSRLRIEVARWIQSHRWFHFADYYQTRITMLNPGQVMREIIIVGDKGQELCREDQKVRASIH